jgi:hypothetical protein
MASCLIMARRARASTPAGVDLREPCTSRYSAESRFVGSWLPAWLGRRWNRLQWARNQLNYRKAIRTIGRSSHSVSMPATLILLPAVVIGVIAWLAAWWYTRTSAGGNAHDELQRLGNHAAWLEQRLDVARRERWDHEMLISLSDQLGTACNALARARRRSQTRTLSSAR